LDRIELSITIKDTLPPCPSCLIRKFWQLFDDMFVVTTCNLLSLPMFLTTYLPTSISFAFVVAEPPSGVAFQRGPGILNGTVSMVSSAVKM
jgi:hypothetical protein